MKKQFMLLVALLLPLCVVAQEVTPQEEIAKTTTTAAMKIAVVNIDSVYNCMPEKKAAEETLAQTSAQLQKEFKAMQDDFGKKYAAYQKLANDASVLPTIKERRMQEIQAADDALQAFLKKADAELNQLSQSLKTPIMQKIQEAINTVGESGNYTYIIDVSKHPVAFMGATGIDVTNQVKSILGLKAPR